MAASLVSALALSACGAPAASYACTDRLGCIEVGADGGEVLAAHGVVGAEHFFDYLNFHISSPSC